MADRSDSQSSAIVAAFLDRFLADQSRGEVKPLSRYCAAFPGHDDVIAQHYEKLVEDGAKGPDAERRVGHYRILEEIGRGGQGEVHLAFDLKLERRVALKVLRRLDVGSPEVMTRFRREAAIASRLDHPAIATVYDSGVADGVPYIAMRYVRGDSLGQRIRQARDSGTKRDLVSPISQTGHSSSPKDGSGSAVGSGSVTDLRSRAGVNATVYFIEEAARAVHAAHAAGIIHRDLKPGNIMVTPEGRPVILDFGLARDLDNDQASFTQSGDLFGTPHYMSPEQLAANRVPLDARTDVYSLALTLYEALTFERPFDAGTREGVYQSVLTKQPPDPRKFNSGISDDLRVVLSTALEKDRDRRYESAAAFADDLQCVRKDLPIQARPIGLASRAMRWVRREPLMAAFLVTLLALALLAGYALSKWPADRRAREVAARVKKEEAIESNLERGFEALHNSRREGSVERFKEALALDPNLPEAIAGLALAHMRWEQYSEALAALDRYRPLSETHLGLRLLRQSIRKRLGQLVADTIPAEELAASKDPVTWFVRAAQEMHRGHLGDDAGFERAADLLLKCILSAPQTRPLYRMELAHAVGHLDRPQQALRIADAITARDPKLDDEMNCFWYTFLLHRSHPKLALPVAERLTKRWPDRSASHQLIGTCKIQLGQFEEGLASIRKSIELDPTNLVARNNLVVALDRLKRYDEAVQEGRKALRRFPDHTLISRSYGIMLNRTGDAEGAIRILKPVAERLPGDLDVLRELARAYRKLDKHDEAAATYERLSALEPANTTYVTSRAEEVRDGGNPERALELLDRAVLDFPADDGVHAARAFTLSRLRRFKECVAAWDRAVSLNNDDARYFYDRGIALYRVNRFADAVASFERSVELKGDFPEAHCNLAHAYRKVDKFAEAKAAYEKAHAMGMRRGNWKYPTRRYIRNTMDEARTAHLLERIEGGSPIPTEVDKIVALSQRAFRKQNYALAAELFDRLFQAAPKAADDPRRGRGFNASNAAIRAAQGFGKSANLSLEDRLDLRRLSLRWFSDDMKRWKELMEASDVPNDVAETWLLRWKKNPAFAVVREGVDRLPEDVAARWSEAWRTLDRLLESVKQR